MLREVKMSYRTVKPVFSYRMLGVTRSTWSIQSLEVNFDTTKTPTCNADALVVRQNFQRQYTITYGKTECIYTDCSGEVELQRVACGRRVSVMKWCAWTLREENSIFTAELYAIVLAMGAIKGSKKKEFVIFSDSYSVLTKLSTLQYSDAYVRAVQHKLCEQKQRNRRVVCC